MQAPSAMFSSFMWRTRALRLPPTRAVLVSVRLPPAMVRSRPMVPLTSALPAKMVALRFTSPSRLMSPAAAGIPNRTAESDGFWVQDGSLPHRNAPLHFVEEVQKKSDVNRSFRFTCRIGSRQNRNHKSLPVRRQIQIPGCVDVRELGVGPGTRFPGCKGIALRGVGD